MDLDDYSISVLCQDHGQDLSLHLGLLGVNSGKALKATKKDAKISYSSLSQNLELQNPIVDRDFPIEVAVLGHPPL